MKSLISLILLVASAQSFAQAPQTIPNDNLKLGKTSAGNKTIIFENAAGSANPKLRWNNSSTQIEYSNDGTNFFGFVAAPEASYELTNVGISATVSSNALTLALVGGNGSAPSTSNVVKIGFRSATTTSGQFTVASITNSNPTLLVASGSTLGCTSAASCILHVYVLNNAGTYVLGVSGVHPAYPDNTIVASTTNVAAGGGGNADTAGVIYSASGYSNIVSRYIGRVVITEATAGTWASAPTHIQLASAGSGHVGFRAYSTINSLAFDGVSAPVPATKIPFETIDYDTHGGYNGTDTYTVPTTQGGLWRCGVSLFSEGFTAEAGDAETCMLAINGALVTNKSMLYAHEVSDDSTTYNNSCNGISSPILLRGGDTLSIATSNDDADNNKSTATIGQYSNFFWCERMK